MMDKVLDLHIPGLRLDLSANKRVHFMTRARKVAAERKVVHYSLLATGVTPPKPPLRIVMTRIGPRKMDTDNASSTLKGSRDAIAGWLKVDDGHRDLCWICGQTIGPFGLHIEIYQ